MKKLFLTLLILSSFSTSVFATKYVSVKYRNTKVDVQNGYFKCINTSKSSFVKGACYDESNEYMLIQLKSTVYQYCNLDIDTWNSFKKAKSFGTYYNNNIKGDFSCIGKQIPSY